MSRPASSQVMNLLDPELPCCEEDLADDILNDPTLADCCIRDIRDGRKAAVL
jgi:hypothetical protein